MIRHFYLIHLCLLSLVLPAQNVFEQVEFEHYSIYDGLSQSSINNMIQDSKGFIWLTTEEGLNKFDGYTFKTYKSKSTQKIRLSNTYLINVAESHSGNILICSQSGLDIFDITNDSLNSFIYNPDDPTGLLHNELTCALDVKLKDEWKIFIGTKAGLNILNEKVKEFQQFCHDPTDTKSIGSNIIYEIIQDSKENIWIGTHNGLDLFSTKNNTFEHYYIDTIDTERNRIKTIFEDKSSNLWIGTFNGMYKFVPETGQFIPYKEEFKTNDNLSNSEINAICQDYAGNFYVGTTNGLNYIEPLKHCITNYLFDSKNTNGLSNNYIFSLLTDRDENIWIGTYGGGLNKINNYRKKFVNYIMDPQDKNSLNVPDVICIYEDKNEILWLGTHGGGLNKFDRYSNTFTHYIHDPRNPKSIGYNLVRAICEDQFGKLWLGTDGGGISIFDKQTEEFNHFRNNPDDSTSLIGNVIRDIKEDHLGNIWISTFGEGLDLYDRESNSFIHYRHDQNDPNSLGSNHTYSIHENDSYELWITTSGGGINKYNRESDNFTVFLNDNNNPNNFYINWVLEIFKDKKGIYWIAADNGLYIFDEQNKELRSLDSNNEILSSMIYSILEDTHGNIWFSSNNGISKYNPITEELYNYGIKEGVKSKEFWGQSGYKNEKGEMFFGGINGITAFYPDSIEDSNLISPVYLLDIKIFDKSIEVGKKTNNRIILEKSIISTDKIILTHQEKSITFEFVAVNFINPENTQYAYFLEGFDKDWNYIQTRRFATFTNLPPGEYIFKVKASTNNGKDWSTEQAQIRIKMLPPFWKTWWFIIILLFTIIGSISYWYWNKLYQIKKQNILLEEKVQERTKEIVAQKEQIEKKNKILNKQKEQIEEKNMRLETQKEELASQRDALVEANNTKDKFFSIISHDLKSPFNSLLGFAELIIENLPNLSKDKIQKYADQIYSSSKHLYSLVENLLAWSRSKRNVIKVFPEVLDLSDVIEDTISLGKITAKKKQIEILPDIDKNITVYSDENLISATLRNLLSNAIKYSMENSTIKITSKVNKRFAEISIADTGTGIKKEDLNKLFREDIHFTTKGTKDEKGTGLGLILCKEFAERNGGKIWVESELGEGTSFTFTIPISVES